MSNGPQFARKTRVSVAQSEAEIRRLVERYGAGKFGIFVDKDARTAAIEFTIGRRRVRFILTSPAKLTPQRERARWRSLMLAIKAKLDAVHVGISTFEEEFLAHIVMPDGRRFGETVVPQLEYYERSDQGGA